MARSGSVRPARADLGACRPAGVARLLRAVAPPARLPARSHVSEHAETTRTTCRSAPRARGPSSAGRAGTATTPPPQTSSCRSPAAAAFPPGRSQHTTTNESRFCNTRVEAAIGTGPNGPQQQRSGRRAHPAWDRLSTERSSTAPPPSHTPTTSSSPSSPRASGNYQFDPKWGVLLDQLWVHLNAPSWRRAAWPYEDVHALPQICRRACRRCLGRHAESKREATGSRRADSGEPRSACPRITRAGRRRP